MPKLSDTQPLSEKISLVARTIADLAGCGDDFFKNNHPKADEMAPQWVFMYILHEHLGLKYQAICDLMNRKKTRHLGIFKNRALEVDEARSLLLAVLDRLDEIPDD